MRARGAAQRLLAKRAGFPSLFCFVGGGCPGHPPPPPTPLPIRFFRVRVLSRVGINHASRRPPTFFASKEAIIWGGAEAPSPAGPFLSFFFCSHRWKTDPDLVVPIVTDGVPPTSSHKNCALEAGPRPPGKPPHPPGTR